MARPGGDRVVAARDEDDVAVAHRDRLVERAVVGDDLYDIRGHGATWTAAEALYRAHPTKAFAFPEWGLWGVDDPQFVRDMAKWVHTHRRTEFIVYYEGKPGSVFDLAAKPSAGERRW